MRTSRTFCCGYLHPPGLKMPPHFLQQALPYSVLLQQMEELAHHGFVRCTLPSQIDAHEFTHGQGVAESFFHRRIGQIEPVLEKAVRSMHSRPTGLSPFPVEDRPALSMRTGQTRATTRSIPDRNAARRVVLAYWAKPPEGVICLIVRLRLFDLRF